MGRSGLRVSPAAAGRLNVVKDSGNPVFEKFTERNWRILDVLVAVAKALERSPAEVALNWAATQPGITSVILGATKASQLEQNLAALDFEIPAGLRSRLDEVSALEPIHPYVFLGSYLRQMFNGGVEVRPWSRHGA